MTLLSVIFCDKESIMSPMSQLVYVLRLNILQS